MKRVAIVGLGRVGGALALGLKAAGWDVRVQTRSPAKARKLKLKLAKDLAAERLVLLAVPDTLVGDIEATLAVPDTAAVVHCAGALELTALNATRRGSFHPLVAVSSARDTLAGGWVAISASEKPLLGTLRQLAKALKMTAFEVPERDRAAYHAGAVMSAGLMLSLLDAAAEATGLPRKVAEPALIALAESALRGARHRGIAASLTGPIVRGDADVVRRHLEALAARSPALAELYRALSRRALALSGRAALDGIDLGP